MRAYDACFKHATAETTTPASATTTTEAVAVPAGQADQGGGAPES
jgi:hypothetical protein